MNPGINQPCTSITHGQADCWLRDFWCGLIKLSMMLWKNSKARPLENDTQLTNQVYFLACTHTYQQKDQDPRNLQTGEERVPDHTAPNPGGNNLSPFQKSRNSPHYTSLGSWQLQEHRVLTQRQLLHSDTSQGKCAEHLLLGKLATFLPQDVVLWRFQNTWPFTCCSTLELRAFSTAVLYLHDTQSIITCSINLFMCFHAPAFPPRDSIIHLTESRRF